MSDPYVNLEDLYEPIIAAFKSELDELEIFQKISEGEEVYSQDLEAWVIPGRDRIESAGHQMFHHFLEVNVIVFSTAEGVNPEELRPHGHQAYNKLMEDITHGGTCRWAFPNLFHPGYMQVGDLLTVGILMQFTAHFMQFYPFPPS